MTETGNKLRGKVIWVLDDDETHRMVPEQLLKPQGATVRTFSELDALLEAFAYSDRSGPDLLITDAGFSSEVQEIISAARNTKPERPIIIRTADEAFNLQMPGVQVVYKMGGNVPLMEAVLSALDITPIAAGRGGHG